MRYILLALLVWGLAPSRGDAQVCFAPNSSTLNCPKLMNPTGTNGWMTVSDLAHQTQVSSLLVTDGVTTTIPIDTSGTQTVTAYRYQLNQGIWHPANNTFCPDHEGDLYLFNLRFTAAKTANSTASLGVVLQISGAAVIQSMNFPLVKSQNQPQDFSITWMQNAGAQFVSNCANFRLIPNGSNVNLWNPRLQITEIFRPGN